MSRCGDCKLGCYEQDTFYCKENLGYEQCIDRLQDALYAADRPSGEWIHNPNGIDRNFVWWKCSECGHVIYSESERDREEFHAFCGRCGAKMKGASNENSSR